MAYKLPLTPECGFDGCRHAASYVVFTNKRATVGEYCKTHADQQVRKLEKAEELTANSMAATRAKKVSRDKIRRRA